MLARPQVRPAPPGCIAALLDADDLRFEDGGRRLSARVWVVDREDARSLASLVLAADRGLPVFALTPRDDDAIDGGWLLEQVPGLAHVLLIKPGASWELNGVLPDGLNVYGGAARLWWPGVTMDSNKLDHQLWTASVEARRVTGAARGAILEAGRTASLVDHRVVEFERRRQDERSARLQRELEEARSAANAARRELAARSNAAKEDVSVRADSAVEEAQERVLQALREDAAEALELAASYEGEARAATERATEAERQHGHLSYEVGRLRRLLESRDISELVDESAGVLGEVEDEIEARGDVAGARNREVKLGPAFIATLEAHGPNHRQKVIRACADVAIGSQQLLARRDDHALRTGEGANDPQRVRASDGAPARRCYIEHNTPAARRLHYWVLGDGTVEFASVNVHDDMNIPE
ncbi:MAG: hypothetical protein ACRDIW_04895 [Actinomycetota bacterium]